MTAKTTPTPKTTRDPEEIAVAINAAQAELLALHLAADPAAAGQAHRLHYKILGLQEAHQVAVKPPTATPREGRTPEEIAVAIDAKQAELLALHLAADPAAAGQAHRLAYDIAGLESEYRNAMGYGPEVQLYT